MESTKQTRKYIATAKVYGGRFAVCEILTPLGELHQIGDCRDFSTFDEADDVARDMAAGKYPHIRPAGEYISNR